MNTGPAERSAGPVFRWGITFFLDVPFHPFTLRRALRGLPLLATRQAPEIDSDQSEEAFMASAAEEQKNELLVPVTQHWMKARIDAPLASMDRLDQNAKQVIALAAGVQAVLIAVIKLAEVTDKAMLSFAAVSFSLLFSSTVCCAILLYRQPAYIGMTSIVSFLKQNDPPQIVNLLATQIEEMCREVDRLLRDKRRLLALALGFFAASTLSSIGCLILMILKAGTQSPG
jgi:hypothetical protein